jgi:hypothetical protein
MKTSKNNFVLCFAVITISALSCKTRQGAPRIDVADPDGLVLDSNQFRLPTANFEWFDGKFSGTVNDNGKSNSIKGRVKIRADSVIWISIKPDVAIIEVARLVATPDSVKLLNYLEKKYWIGTYSALSAQIGFALDYPMLEALLTGAPNLIFRREAYLAMKSTDGISLTSSSLPDYLALRRSGTSPRSVFQALWFDAAGNLKRNLIYEPTIRVETDIQFSNFVTTDSLTFPYQGSLTLVGDSSSAQFKFEYTKIDLNTSTTFPFSIPSSYTKME